MHYIGTISQEHVGKVCTKFAGITVWWPDVIGQVLPQDVGKRVYINVSPSGYRYLTVESTEQRDMRLGTHKPCTHARTIQRQAYGNIHCLTCGKQWNCNTTEYRDDNALHT